MDGDSPGHAPKAVAFDAPLSVENERSKCSTGCDGSQGGSKQDEADVQKFLMSDGISSKQSTLCLLSAPTIEDEYNQAWDQFGAPTPLDSILSEEARSPYASNDSRKNGCADPKQGEWLQRSTKKDCISSASSRSLISGSSSVPQEPVEPAKVVHLGALEMPREPKRASRRRTRQVTPIIDPNSDPVKALQKIASLESQASAASQSNVPVDDWKVNNQTSAASDESSLGSPNVERTASSRTMRSRANNGSHCIASQVAPFIRVNQASAPEDRDSSLPMVLNEAITDTVASLQSITLAAGQAVGERISTLLMAPAAPMSVPGDDQAVDARASSPPQADNNDKGDPPNNRSRKRNKNTRFSLLTALS
eukprot:GEMP01033745.1.p1 GENE.GEMP01033745.1~~GEMP01033745.1.p1  ORF type:complete len:365 (+),score=63.73 GEMP01033745.1:191-1285(+)